MASSWSTRIRRGTIWRVLIITAAVALLSAGWTASAAAGSHARAFIYEGKGDCGSVDTRFPHMGAVGFARSGNTLTVDVRIHLASAAGETYDIKLFVPSCTVLADLGTIAVDAKGSGTGSFTADDTGQAVFFVSVTPVVGPAGETTSVLVT